MFLYGVRFYKYYGVPHLENQSCLLDLSFLSENKAFLITDNTDFHGKTMDFSGSEGL
jgi:hypothetical protein